MSWRRGLAGITVAIALLVALPGPAGAGDATERVREFFASVNRVIADPAEDRRPEERLAALRTLVMGMIEFRTAAQIALGAEWAGRTAAQQDEFVTLFADLLQTSVFGSVGGRARIDNGLTVSYIGELADPRGITVATTVLARSANEIAVGYRMLSRDGIWMVYDVVIDGVSLVENYRAQFHKVIQRSSYAGLVGEMRARLVELGRGTVLASAPVPAATATVTPVAAVVPAPVTTSPPPREEIAAAVTPPASVPAPREVVRTPVLAAPPAAPLLTAARPVDTAPPAPARIRPSVETRAALDAHSTPGTRARPGAHAMDAAYWVQVGAFRSDEAAIKVVGALGDQEVSLLRMPDTPLLRVLVGPFENRQAAATKLREIRARGLDGFVAELAP